jgi:hypothetical protein
MSGRPVIRSEQIGPTTTVVPNADNAISPITDGAPDGEPVAFTGPAADYGAGSRGDTIGARDVDMNTLLRSAIRQSRFSGKTIRLNPDDIDA